MPKPRRREPSTGTTDHDELTTLRRYTRKQAADLLAIPETWLKVGVAGHHVPHQRSGKPGPRQRGVWFTFDDIREIGRMLPGLQCVRRTAALRTPGSPSRPSLLSSRGLTSPPRP